MYKRTACGAFTGHYDIFVVASLHATEEGVKRQWCGLLAIRLRLHRGPFATRRTTSLTRVITTLSADKANVITLWQLSNFESSKQQNN